MSYSNDHSRLLAIITPPLEAKGSASVSRRAGRPFGKKKVARCTAQFIGVHEACLDFNSRSSSNTPSEARDKLRAHNMPQGAFASRLFLWTSRRLGSAPVRLACIQRGPRRGLVLVCPRRRHIYLFVG
jgi:hypothetical protein